uniref:DUF4283 domain-containing protein n=1 Tax=Tanacetum cinerariifolium TaxID=118510 RepID=A0A6L2JYW7_TANCI|nr:hypothetical protein [Tanacetum cinerariifolium]
MEKIDDVVFSLNNELNDAATTLRSCLKASQIRNIDGKVIGKDKKLMQPIPKSKSFVNVLHMENKTPKVNFRSLFNEEKVDDVDFVLPKENVGIAHNRFANSLDGFFVGKRVAFPLVQNYVNNTWSKFGFQSVIKDDDDVYYFKFTSTTGLEQVLEKGPWMVSNQPLILTKWALNLDLSKDAVTKVPIWVKIHKEVTMAGSLLNEEGHVKEKMIVDYDWKPPRCSECNVFGHDINDCPKRIVEPAKEATDQTDGFTTVRTRKSKGKKVENETNKHIEGLKLSKPKPKYTWSVKSNQNKDKASKSVQHDSNGVTLKNNFIALQDDDTFDYNNDPNLYASTSKNVNEVESEVEEIDNEFNANDGNGKGASTPFDEVLYV